MDEQNPNASVTHEVPAPLASFSELCAELELPIEPPAIALESCAALLSASGRPALLAHLKQQGIVAGHAQKIATVIARSLRSGRLVLDNSAALPPSLPNEPSKCLTTDANEALQAAASAGDTLTLSQCLADARASAASRAAALVITARRGHAECVSALLAHRTPPDATSSDGGTALHAAARRGHLAVARELCSARADPSLAVRGGSTPLHAASGAGHEAVVELLCSRGAAVNARRPDGSMALMDAAQQGRHACVHALITAGADAHACMHHGWSALLVAALHGHGACVDMLCSHGVDVNSRDVDGTSALLLSAQRGHTDCVSVLLAARADPDAPRADGLRALHYACLHGHTQCVELLVEAGAAVEARDNEQWSPMLYAAHAGHDDVIELLVTRGSAALDGARPNGLTPLMAACAAGCAATATMLLRLGADVQRTKRQSCHLLSALEHAHCGEHPETCTAALLEDAQAVDGARRIVGDLRACDDDDTAGAIRLMAHVMEAGDFGIDASPPATRRILFRVPPHLDEDESWQERPVRRNGVNGEDTAGAGMLAPALAYLTNSTSPHGINVIHLVLRDHGFKRVQADNDAASSPPTANPTAGSSRPPWSLYWCGGPLDVRTVHALLPWQRVSKFPLSKCLTLKQRLWTHYKHMRTKHGPAHFDFMPQSFVLPDEHAAWRAHAREPSSDGWWIVKPNNASRSRGVYLVRGDGDGDACASDDGAAATTPTASADVCGVVCAYLQPLLIDGIKFDLRLYALVTSWTPLVVYIYSDGLARFATGRYALDPSTCHDSSVHLTNATCNPKAHRLMLPQLKERIARDHGDERAAALWTAVDDLVAKTMLSVEGTMQAALCACSLRVATGRPNTQCFQLFGLDVLIDCNLKPWLLEVNLDPSLHTCDLAGTAHNANARLKAGLVVDTLNLVGVCAPPPQQQPQHDEEDPRVTAERLRTRTPAEAWAGAITRVDAELVRTSGGGWRRLLPARGRSEACARFVGEARRELHLLPYAEPC